MAFSVCWLIYDTNKQCFQEGCRSSVLYECSPFFYAAVRKPSEDNIVSLIFSLFTDILTALLLHKFNQCYLLTFNHKTKPAG